MWSCEETTHVRHQLQFSVWVSLGKSKATWVQNFLDFFQYPHSHPALQSFRVNSPAPNVSAVSFFFFFFFSSSFSMCFQGIQFSFYGNSSSLVTLRFRQFLQYLSRTNFRGRHSLLVSIQLPWWARTCQVREELIRCKHWAQHAGQPHPGRGKWCSWTLFINVYPLWVSCI